MCQSILFYSTQKNEKSLNAKKLKGWTLLDFSTSILSQKMKGDPVRIFFPKKKSRNAEKKLRMGPFGLVRYCVTQETFLVQFPGRI